MGVFQTVDQGKEWLQTQWDQFQSSHTGTEAAKDWDKFTVFVKARGEEASANLDAMETLAKKDGRQLYDLVAPKVKDAAKKTGNFISEHGLGIGSTLLTMILGMTLFEMNPLMAGLLALGLGAVTDYMTSKEPDHGPVGQMIGGIKKFLHIGDDAPEKEKEKEKSTARNTITDQALADVMAKGATMKATQDKDKIEAEYKASDSEGKLITVKFNGNVEDGKFVPKNVQVVGGALNLPLSARDMDRLHSAFPVTVDANGAVNLEKLQKDMLPTAATMALGIDTAITAANTDKVVGFKQIDGDLDNGHFISNFKMFDLNHKEATVTVSGHAQNGTIITDKVSAVVDGKSIQMDQKELDGINSKTMSFIDAQLSKPRQPLTETDMLKMLAKMDGVVLADGEYLKSLGAAHPAQATPKRRDGNLEAMNTHSEATTIDVTIPDKDHKVTVTLSEKQSDQVVKTRTLSGSVDGNTLHVDSVKMIDKDGKETQLTLNVDVSGVMKDGKVDGEALKSSQQFHAAVKNAEVQADKQGAQLAAGNESRDDKAIRNALDKFNDPTHKVDVGGKALGVSGAAPSIDGPLLS